MAAGDSGKKYCVKTSKLTAVEVESHLITGRYGNKISLKNHHPTRRHDAFNGGRKNNETRITIQAFLWLHSAIAIHLSLFLL